MSEQTESLIDRLYQAGNPRDLSDWDRRDGYYVATCRISQSDVPQLLDLAEMWLDPAWSAENPPPNDPELAELLPVTAWRALADLRPAEAVEPLVKLLCQLDDATDDWVHEDLPVVFGKIGEPSIEPLMRAAADDSLDDYVRFAAACGLRHVAEFYPELRDRIVPLLTELMANARADHREFNSLLLVELVKLNAVEAAEPIERAFAADLLDVGMMGDWEAVRANLKVEGLGLKMPEHPYNSIKKFFGQGRLEEAPPLSGFAFDDADAPFLDDYDDPTVDAPPSPRTYRVGRNDPCPCGSGMKYKKCCGRNSE